jgi:hypothetical protein
VIYIVKRKEKEKRRRNEEKKEIEQGKTRERKYTNAGRSKRRGKR